MAIFRWPSKASRTKEEVLRPWRCVFGQEDSNALKNSFASSHPRRLESLASLVSRIPRTKLNSIITYYSTQNSISWEANSRQENQKILDLLFNLKIHYSIHNSPHNLPIILCEFNAKQQLTIFVITHFSENLCCHDSRQSECEYPKMYHKYNSMSTHLPLNLWHGWDVQGNVQYYFGCAYEIKENIHFNRGFQTIVWWSPQFGNRCNILSSFNSSQI
jgi:hypothetical protein